MDPLLVTPSHQIILAKIHTLKVERDSLLTTIKVLTRNQESKTNISSNVTSQSTGSTPQPDLSTSSKSPTSKSMPNEKLKSSEKKSVTVIGDSMTKNIIGPKLSRNYNSYSRSFPGATIEDITDYMKPSLRRKPDVMVIHDGANNIASDSPESIKDKMSNVVNAIRDKNPSIKIAFSSIIKRRDSHLNTKIIIIHL